MPYVPLVPADGTFLTLDEIARIFVNAVDSAAVDPAAVEAATSPYSASPSTLAPVSPAELSVESPVEMPASETNPLETEPSEPSLFIDDFSRDYELIARTLGPDPDEDPAYWARTNDALGRETGPRLPPHFLAIDRPIPGGNRLDVFAFDRHAGEFVAVAHDSTNPAVHTVTRAAVAPPENLLTSAFLGDIALRLNLRLTLSPSELAHIWGSDEAAPSVATKVIEYHVSPHSRPQNTLAQFTKFDQDLPADEAFVTRTTLVRTPRGARHLLVGLAVSGREPSIKPIILRRPRNSGALDAHPKYPRIAYPEELTLESEVWWSSKITHVMGCKNVRGQSFVTIDSETCVETLDFEEEVSWENPFSLLDRAVWRRAFSTGRDVIVGDFVDWLEGHKLAGLGVLALFPPALVGNGEHGLGYSIATILKDFQTSRVVKTRFPTHALDELLDQFRERPGIASELVGALENPTEEFFHNLFFEVERLRRHAEFVWCEPSSIDMHSSMTEWMSWCEAERLDASAAFAAVWGEENSTAHPEDAEHRVSPVPLVVARELAERRVPPRSEERVRDDEERDTRDVVDTLRQMNAHREADWIHARVQESLDAVTNFDSELDGFRSESQVSTESTDQHLPWERDLFFNEAFDRRPQPLRDAITELSEIWRAGPPARKLFITGLIL